MDLFSIPFLPILQDFVFSPVRPKWFIKIKICNLKNQDPELFYFKRMENREIFGKPETYSFCYPIFRPERNHTIVQILLNFFPSYRPKRDLSKSLWRDSESDDLNEDGCTGEKEYCEIVDACVDDCDLFHTKDDSTPFVIVCKEGLVSLK